MCAYRPFPAACDGQRECRVVQSGGAERLRGRVVTPGATAYAVIELDHSSCEVPQARACRMTSEPFRCAYCPRVAPGSKAHDWNVEVQLLYFDGCPHWTVAEERLRLALASTGNGGQAIEHVLVETPIRRMPSGWVSSGRRQSWWTVGTPLPREASSPRWPAASTRPRRGRQARRPLNNSLSFCHEACCRLGSRVVCGGCSRQPREG